MPTIQKPRIGLLGLMLELYDRSNPTLRPAQEQFATQLVGKLGEIADVTYTGIVNTRAGVQAAMAEFEAADVDLVMPVHFSYSPSLIAMQALVDCPRPVVLFNTQRKRAIDESFDGQDVLRNHGMHGQQDLANVLVRSGRAFGVCTGYWEDNDTLEELSEWARAAAAMKQMKSLEIGLFGYPFQDMGDFGVDETLFHRQTGAHVQHVSLQELAEAMAGAAEDDARRIVEEDRARFDIAEDLTESEHIASAKAELGLRSVVSHRGLGAIAIHYEVLGHDPRFSALPFAGVTKLISEGVGFGGEGDITSAAGVAAMGLLTGEATFTEMFCMDFEGGAILMSHFAEGNLNFASGKPKLVRRDGWVGSGGPSASLAFDFDPGPVTLVNLTIGAGEKVKLIAATAEIEPYALPGGQTPHCKLRPDLDLEMFLDAYLYYGGSHHVALVKGNQLPLVDKFAELSGLELFVI